MLNASRVWHAVTPADPRRACNYFFAMSSTDPKQLDFLFVILDPEDVVNTRLRSSRRC